MMINAMNVACYSASQLRAQIERTERAIKRAEAVLASLDARYLADDTLAMLDELKGMVR
jgi:hypothetical protein